MNEGWLELESDPGLFTLLVEEFGVTGVQVEEIYDLQKPIEGPVYGFIFLFKWIEERRARRKVQTNGDEAYLTDVEAAGDMFFAHQKMPNSCATHALLSVLLNCHCVQLGSTLRKLKDYTRDFSAENKGYAIGNVPELAQIHNSHAHPEPRQVPEKQMGLTTTRARETFHFVSYVPIKNRLIELDGLKPYPIDHGPWGENEDWTEKFRRVISERLENEGGSSDIRFNLMAVVGDRCQSYEQKLETLKNNKQIILDALDKLIRATHPHLFTNGRPQPSAPPPTGQPPDPGPRPAQSPGCPDAKQGPPEGRRDRAGTHTAQPVQPTPDWALSASATATTSAATTTTAAAAAAIPSSSSSGRKEKKKKKKKKKHKKHKKHCKKVKAVESIQQYRLPPALDNHNYAKSPLISDEEAASVPSSTTSASGSESNYQTDDESEEDRAAAARSSKIEGILKSLDEDKAMGPGPAHGGHRVTFSDRMPHVPPPPQLLPQQQQQQQQQQGSIRRPLVEPEADLASQLRIQTVFDAGAAVAAAASPSSLSSDVSTDTASEVGSAFNSPLGSRDISPTSSPDPRSPAWRGAGAVLGARERLEASLLTPGGLGQGRGDAWLPLGRLALPGQAALRRLMLPDLGTHRAGTMDQGPGAQASPCTLLSQHGKPPFAQRDLLELLKSVEGEIDGYEQKLLDEKEKRNKYKIDDCRRSHNYDPFICTFLSMLAEQGKLASLVEKHALIKRRQGVSLGRLTKATSRKRDRRRRKSRPRSSVPAKKRKIR